MPPRGTEHTPSLASQAQELANEATGEMIARSRQREADAAVGKAPPLTRARVTLIALCAALPMLAVLVAVTFFGDALADMLSPPPSPQIARAQAQAELDATVTDIEAFRADFSALPQTLVQVAAPVRGGWSYIVDGDHYRLSRTLHGQVVTFTSVPKSTVPDEK